MDGGRICNLSQYSFLLLYIIIYGILHISLQEKILLLSLWKKQKDEAKTLRPSLQVLLFLSLISGNVRSRNRLLLHSRRRNHLRRNRIRSLRRSSCSAYPEFLRW